MCWKRFHPSKVKSGQWSCVLMMAGWPVTKRHTQKRTWCQQQNENLVALDFKIYTMKINMTLQHAHLQYRKYIFKRWMFHCRVSFREGGKFANIDSEQIWPRIQNERKHSRRDELCLLKLFPSCAKQCGCDSELRFQRKPHNDHIYYSPPLIGNHCNGYINPLPLKVDEFIPSVDKLPTTLWHSGPAQCFFNPGTMTARKIGNPNSASPMVSIKIMAYQTWHGRMVETQKWHLHL